MKLKRSKITKNRGLSPVFYTMKKKGILYVLLATFICACTTKNESIGDNVVVKVNDKSLYVKDVAGLVPQGISPEDSIDIAQKYIQKWITRELIVQKAIFNVGENDPEIKQLVEDYRNSLLVKKYTEMLLEHKAEVDPTEEEIAEYYESNSQNYPLTHDIVQGVIIKIPADAPRQKDLKTWLESDSGYYTDIEGYCYQHAITYDDFREKWIAFKLINNLMPQGLDKNYKWQKEKFVEQTDTVYNYFVKITSLKKKNEVAPKTYVEQKIITLLRHKKKLEYFEKFEKDIYNEGIKDEAIVYNPHYE